MRRRQAGYVLAGSIGLARKTQKILHLLDRKPELTTAPQEHQSPQVIGPKLAVTRRSARRRRKEPGALVVANRLKFHPTSICQLSDKHVEASLLHDPVGSLDPVVTTGCNLQPEGSRPVSDCGCHGEEAKTRAERRVLGIALVLNAGMFVIEATSGWIAGSSALLADALDMLADALGYAIALAAVGRSELFKTRAALRSGLILAILGVSVIVETGRRAVLGSTPEGSTMLAVATLALIVNSAVLWMLARYRDGAVHLRASWIFTRADVIANVAIIFAALLMRITGSRVPDLVIGLAIGVYVVREALEIRSMASKKDLSQPAGGGP
jgi:hypothetical protein